MKKATVLLSFYAVFLVMVASSSSSTAEPENAMDDSNQVIGRTRVPREEKVAMEMAVNDFHQITCRSLALQNSWSQAISIAIVRSLTWQEATVIGEMNENSSEIPIISLTDSASLTKQAHLQPVIHMGYDISLLSNSEGLRSRISFDDNYTVKHMPVFGIANVIGKRYKELGFWSPIFGFLKNSVAYDSSARRRKHSSSAEQLLGSVHWPGSRSSVLTRSTSESTSSIQKPLMVLVPAGGSNGNKTSFTGFSIDVFIAADTSLPFNGSYDDIVRMVYHKSFDAAVGDVEIKAYESSFVEFTQSLADTSEEEMAMLIQSDNSVEPWMFMKPFTMGMWSALAGMSFFTGFVLWLIEHRTNPLQQMGNFFWFSFSTLYLGQRESLTQNLSRIVMALWLFLILIVAACFTANLTSMMTTSMFVPSNVDVEHLRRTNAKVGSDGSTVAVEFLIEVLGFEADNINIFSTVNDFAEAFTNGKIEAAFLLSPHGKKFLATYCKGFTISGPSYELSGFGYVFQNSMENGTLSQTKDEMLSFLQCFSSDTSTTTPDSLGPGPFLGLFVVCGSVSVIALLITVINLMREHFQIQRIKELLIILKGKEIFMSLMRVLQKRTEEHASAPQGEGRDQQLQNRELESRNASL